MGWVAVVPEVLLRACTARQWCTADQYRRCCPPAAASMPTNAPCAQCLRDHGDPIHASQGRRCCLPAASMPPSCVRRRWPPSWRRLPTPVVRELLLIANLSQRHSAQAAVGAAERAVGGAGAGAGAGAGWCQWASWSVGGVGCVAVLA
eukprot:COSAG01_NODE_3835_length_5649_cov_36.487474_8_plen_148_part_00